WPRRSRSSARPTRTDTCRSGATSGRSFSPRRSNRGPDRCVEEGVRRKLAIAPLVALALAATVAMAATGSQVVKTRDNATLGKILVNAEGRTLYHLQGETTHH